jgi:hypothetical protein
MLLAMFCSGCVPTLDWVERPPKDKPWLQNQPEDESKRGAAQIPITKIGSGDLTLFLAPSPEKPELWSVQLPPDPPSHPVATGRFDTVVVPAHPAGTLGVLESRSGKLLWCSALDPGPAQPLSMIIPAQEARRSGLSAATLCQVYVFSHRRQASPSTTPTTTTATTRP